MNFETELACKRAFNHLLERIRDDREIGHLLGAGTESYALITKATALLWSQPVDKVRENFIPGSAALHRGGDES